MAHSLIQQKAPYCEAANASLDPATQIDVYEKTFKCLDKISELWADNCYESCEEPCRESRYGMYSEEIDWPHPALQYGLYHEFIINTSLAGIFAEFQNIIDLVGEDDFRRAYDLFVKSQEMWKSMAQVNVRFSTETVLTYVDQMAVSPAQLVGSLGGALNLWVGISFITVVELLELFYHLFTHCTGLGNSNKSKVIDVQTAVPPPRPT